jgi:FAD/FMN-containing dehydrogenase
VHCHRNARNIECTVTVISVITWLVDEFGAEGVEVMRAIKRALEPKGILNPGKMLDA